MARRRIKSKDLDTRGNPVSRIREQSFVSDRESGIPPTPILSAVTIVPPDTKPITPQQAAMPVPGFSTKAGTVTAYPNDVVRLDLFNAANLYLGTQYRVSGWSTINPPNKLTDERQSSIENTAASDITINLNVEKDVQQLGYVAGKYNLRYKFHRNIL